MNNPKEKVIYVFVTSNNNYRLFIQIRKEIMIRDPIIPDDKVIDISFVDSRKFRAHLGHLKLRKRTEQREEEAEKTTLYLECL